MTRKPAWVRAAMVAPHVAAQKLRPCSKTATLPLDPRRDIHEGHLHVNALRREFVVLHFVGIVESLELWPILRMIRCRPHGSGQDPQKNEYGQCGFHLITAGRDRYSWSPPICG